MGRAPFAACSEVRGALAKNPRAAGATLERRSAKGSAGTCGVPVMAATAFPQPRPAPLAAGKQRGVTVQIGGFPILLDTGDADFCALLERRYAGYLNPAAAPACQFEIQIVPPSEPSGEGARASKCGSLWRLERGDFRAEWDARSRRGWVRQSHNPYSIDSVLRMVHSLLLAEEGGFLVHASSGVRRGRASVFAGISGAGKTTMARLAPADVAVLTDEISYIRKAQGGYCAYGTPFAGELARPGINTRAPLAALYFLAKGPAGRIEPMGQLAAAGELLCHILFFANDREIVERVFESAVEFVSKVPVARFTFAPDERAWELVR
jgi:hypothetical protein